MCLMPYANNKDADQSVAKQAGLNLTWSKIPVDTFSRDVAQMMFSHQGLRSAFFTGSTSFKPPHDKTNKRHVRQEKTQVSLGI